MAIESNPMGGVRLSGEDAIAFERQIGDAQLTKRCTKCGEEKPMEEFGKDANKALGVRGSCRQCDAAAARQRRASDPEKYRAAAREREKSPSRIAWANEYYERTGREKSRVWMAEKYKNDEEFRKRSIISSVKTRQRREASDAEFKEKRRVQLAKFIEAVKADPDYRENVRKWDKARYPERKADPAQKEYRRKYARHWRALRRDDEQFEAFMLRMEQEALQDETENENGNAD